MSEEKKTITEKNNVSLDKKNKNHSLKITTQMTESEQTIKTQTCKYKYVYSNTSNSSNHQNTQGNENKTITSTNSTNNINNIDNTNNINNSNIINKTNNNNNIKFTKNISINNNNKNHNSSISNNINTNNKKKIYINSKNYLKKGIFSDKNLHRSPSPLKLKNTCETNYSINNISNVKYVNGNNENVSKINYMRNPEIKFINHEKNEKNFHTKNIKNKMINEYEEKCQCDKNVSCTCGKRKENIKLYEGKIKNINKNINNYLNHNNKIINRNFYLKPNNLKSMNNVKEYKYENINVETYPVFFSDEEINSENNLKSNKKVVKCPSPYSPYNDRNNRSIKISRYYKKNYNYNFNTVDEIRQKTLENMNINNTITNNGERSNCLKNYSSAKKNHNFVNICHCSPNKNNLNTFSPEKNARNASKDSKKEYKYNICIKNINVNKGMNRSVSYGNMRTKKNITNIYTSEEYNNYNSQRSNNSSYDKKDLKMQNAQNMQILQEENLFQLLVPIPPNRIEYSCNLQFSGNEQKKKLTSEEINEIKKRKIIKKTEIINENENKEINYNNVVNKEIIEKNNKKIKRSNWNQTNRHVTDNKLTYLFNKKEKQIPKKKPKIELDMQNFEINIADNGRKFKGEMYIENNNIEIEKQEKDPNSNLLLSPNQAISLKAEYPRKDWNNTSKLVNGRPFSIEGKPKQVLLERSVEKMSIKGKNQKKDWNISNNERKEVNINLYTKKKRQNLSKEKVQPFFIKGKDKNWNYISKKENAENIMIKGVEKDNEEEILINDDYNNIGGNRYIQPINAEIRKVNEISEESISEYDVFKNLHLPNRSVNDYRELIADRMKYNEENKQKVIINQVKGYFPNGIETYRGKKNEVQNLQINVNDVNNVNNVNQEKNIIWYNQKIIKNQNLVNSPKQVNSPENQYIYREVISHEQIDNNEIQPSSSNENNVESDMKKEEDNSKDNQTEFNSPKSQTKYSYREEITLLSPFRNSNDQVEYLSNRISIKSFNQNENQENLNEVLSLSNTNQNIQVPQNEKNIIYKIEYINQNQNQIKNQQNSNININMNNNPKDNLNFIEKTEQQIPKIEDDEIPISNNYNQEISEQSQQSQQKTKYICKRGSHNDKNISNNYFSQLNYQVQTEEENLNNVEETNNLNINYKNNIKFRNYNTIPRNQQNINNNSNIYNYSNNIYYKNINIQEQKLKSPKKEIINQNYINKLQEKELNNNLNNINDINNIKNGINYNNLEIINQNYLNKINQINKLNSQNIQSQNIEVSKSQEMQSSSSQSLIQSFGPNEYSNGNKYENLIKNYSQYIKSGPVENYLNLPTNNLNIISMNAGKYGNIILNNTASSSKEYYDKVRASNKSMKNNEINNKEIDSNNKENGFNSFSFKNLKQKVKILNP